MVSRHNRKRKLNALPTIRRTKGNKKNRSKEKEQESEPQTHAAIESENAATNITTPTQIQVTAPTQDRVSHRVPTFLMNETQKKERKKFYDQIKYQSFFTHKALVKYPLRDYNKEIIKRMKDIREKWFPNCNVKNDLIRKWKVENDVLYSTKQDNEGNSLPITAYEDIYETILKVDMQESSCSNADLGFLVTKISGNITKQMVQYYCAFVSGHRIANKREKKQNDNHGKKGTTDSDDKISKINDLKNCMSKATAAYHVHNQVHV